MGLFKPVYMTDDSMKYHKAIAYLDKHPDVLKDAAIHAPLKSVALAACQRIVSDSELMDIVSTTTANKEVRIEAVRRIKSQKNLYRLSLDFRFTLGDRYYRDIDIEILKCITDQKLLFDLARETDRVYILNDAIKKITDLNYLSRLSSLKYADKSSFEEALGACNDRDEIFAF